MPHAFDAVALTLTFERYGGQQSFKSDTSTWSPPAAFICGRIRS
jgi:hypothetical protein